MGNSTKPSIGYSAFSSARRIAAISWRHPACDRSAESEAEVAREIVAVLLGIAPDNQTTES